MGANFNEIQQQTRHTEWKCEECAYMFEWEKKQKEHGERTTHTHGEMSTAKY